MEHFLIFSTTRYIPFVFSTYSIYFKLKNFSEYFRAMIRIWIMITCLKRRYHEKASLVWLNMCSHWGKHSPQLYKLLRTYITIFDEYLFKNTHSTLCAQMKPSDSANELRNKAKQFLNLRNNKLPPDQLSHQHHSFHFPRTNYTFSKSNTLKYLVLC